MCGVYPIADALDDGTEISSTYEGRHVTLLESELTHPSHADGLVDKGDAVCFGTAVGIAFTSAAAATDYIAVDTEGIWVKDVVASNDAGNSAVTPGDDIYINTSTCVLSKICDGATQQLFGYALGSIDAGSTNTIAVKVHANTSMDNSKRTYYTVTSGAYTYGKHHTSVFAGGQSTGLEYFDQQVTGTQTGGIYGLGTWMELAAGFTGNGSLIVGSEIGIYDAGATLTSGRVVMQQIQGILASNPGTSLHIHRVNIAAAGGAITALYAFANPTSAGYTATGAETSTMIGAMPFADIVGASGIGWIRLYDAAT